MSGTLYVVATPIGNLGDLSQRAREILQHVDLIAAEDTRRARKLLSHVGARAKLKSFHANSPKSRLIELGRVLASGTDVALVTDAGTPSVSDPGAVLVVEARKLGIDVVAIPGPSAVTAALSVSGFPADRYTFLGFLPRKGKERRALLAGATESPFTTVFFEAPGRLVATLKELVDLCGEGQRVGVAREITKVFEEFKVGTPAELTVYYASKTPRGEITLLVEGRSPREREIDRDKVLQAARELLADGLSRKDVVAKLTESLSLARNEVYRLVSSL